MQCHEFYGLTIANNILAKFKFFELFLFMIVLVSESFSLSFFCLYVNSSYRVISKNLVISTILNLTND